MSTYCYYTNNTQTEQVAAAHQACVELEKLTLLLDWIETRGWSAQLATALPACSSQAEHSVCALLH